MSDKFTHSKPINIPNNHNAHGRSRSASYSASSDDDDSNSPPTPPSSLPPPHVNTAYSPSTSPILSYFFHAPGKVAPVVPASPTSAFGTFGRGFSARPQAQPIVEEDEDHDEPFARHARRMSTSAGGAPNVPRTNPPATAEQSERGAGLLRRLSLGGAFARPRPPSPPSPQAAPTVFAPAPTPETKAPAAHGRKKRRASTLGVPEGGRPHRPPSPMGERILTGHFDGF